MATQAPTAATTTAGSYSPRASRWARGAVAVGVAIGIGLGVAAMAWWLMPRRGRRPDSGGDGADDSPSDPFDRACRAARGLAGVAQGQQLRLYALYKRATAGRCGDVGGPQPSAIDFVGRAKWDAWAACDGMSTEAARTEYVQLVAALGGGAAAGSSGGEGAGAEGGDTAGSSGMSVAPAVSRMATAMLTDEEAGTEGGAGAAAPAAAAAASSSVSVEMAGSLYDAVAAGDETLVSRLLVEARSSAGAGGSAINAPLNASGERPLHVAADGGHLPMVRLLLSAGADVAATTVSGETALDYAEVLEREDVATVLRDAAAAAAAAGRGGR